MTVTAPTPVRRDRQGGPPLIVPALAFTGLTVVGAVIGGGGPRPESTAAEVLAYATGHAGLMSLGAALLFGSAFPLVVYAATALRRLRRLGVAAPGPLMGLAGAVLAAGSLMTSALTSWAAVQTASLGDPALARLLATLWFATGGVGFVAPFGLLLVGIAVPALVLKLLPRPLAWAGLAVGVLAMLSTFALFTGLLYPLLPVGRFGGVLFLIAVAVLLPQSTRRREV
jgi:hypothetical protein